MVPFSHMAGSLLLWIGSSWQRTCQMNLHFPVPGRPHMPPAHVCTHCFAPTQRTHYVCLSFLLLLFSSLSSFFSSSLSSPYLLLHSVMWSHFLHISGVVLSSTSNTYTFGVFFDHLHSCAPLPSPPQPLPSPLATTSPFSVSMGECFKSIHVVTKGRISFFVMAE